MKGIVLTHLCKMTVVLEILEYPSTKYFDPFGYCFVLLGLKGTI